jgi:hypothetical protein
MLPPDAPDAQHLAFAIAGKLMPKIDIATVPERRGTGYPAPLMSVPWIASGNGWATQAA